MGNEAHWGYGYRGIWGTWAIGAQGVWGTRGMGHIGNKSHGQWGTWAMGPMGHGAYGQWGPWVIWTFLPITSLILDGFLQKFYWT